MFGALFNQKHVFVFGKTGIGVTLNILKTNYKLFGKKFVPDIALHNFLHVDKNDLVTGGIMIEDPHLYGVLRKHHLIHMSFSEESPESNMGNLDVGKNVSDMLTESQMLKENYDHIPKDVEFDYA